VRGNPSDLRSFGPNSPQFTSESLNESTYIFRDRAEAGRLLAAKLREYANRSDVVVLALPRGGVPVAFEVARALNAPLDVFVVRKLGVPGHEELAMGAIASCGVRVLNQHVLRALGISAGVVDLVILVDDGLATGSSMRVAAIALKQKPPVEIVAAVPVGALETCAEFESEVDKVVCATTPEPFRAVGEWYRDFSQTSDDEVRDLLSEAAKPTAPGRI
jgi:putative phosphoribosyl transferase